MSAWGAPPTSGAWAAQVDEEEEENGGELDPLPPASAKTFSALGGNTDFPTLGETAASKETKKDRKKRQQQKMTLGAFVAAGKKEPEVVHLPTAPRPRAEGEEEKREGLGGGFRNYGGDRGSFRDRLGGDRDEDRGFGRMEEEGPSRADAADDWGTKKAFVPSGAGSRGGAGAGGGGFGDRAERGGFGERYTEKRSGFGDGELNRADDADRWESKGFDSTARKGSGGGGFEEKVSTFGGPTRADTEDRWSRRAPDSGDLSAESRWGSGGLSTASSGTRPRLNLKPRTEPSRPVESVPAELPSEGEPKADEERPEVVPVPRTGPRANPFGSAKPVAIKEPTELARAASQASDPDLHTPPAAVPAAPRIRSNPFGAARPREEVLREKGVDVQKLGSEPAVEDERSEGSGGRSPVVEPVSEDRAVSEPRGNGSTEDSGVGVEGARNALENGLRLDSPPQKPEQKASAGSWAKVASKAPEPAADSVQED